MMKTSITLATLLLTLCTAYAVPPTGTVYRLVEVDSSGVLVNAGTNLITANGIATTGSVAAVQAAAAASLSTGAAAQVTASMALVTGVQAQASADAARATGITAQASAEAAMGQAQLGATNVTGGLLSFTDRMIGLTAAAVSNAMAGVYALVDHLHSFTVITNAPWSSQADYIVTSNIAESAQANFEASLNSIGFSTSYVIRVSGAGYVNVNADYALDQYGESWEGGWGPQGQRIGIEMSGNHWELVFPGEGAMYSSARGVRGPWTLVGGRGVNPPPQSVWVRSIAGISSSTMAGCPSGALPTSSTTSVWVITGIATNESGVVVGITSNLVKVLQ